MIKILLPLLIFASVFEISAQNEVRLPVDFRQHNLTTYNSSFFNPVLSLDRNDPESIAVWTRWQWQDIDADPTTLYVNYSRKLNEKSAIGAAFFQHNTGIFFNTGGVLNYARQIQFSKSVRLSYGFNLFGFVQELADTRFQGGLQLPLPQTGTTSDFILQWAPGASISVERLTLSMASENLFDYNFSAKEANTPAADKMFMGMMSYDFPLNIGKQKALIRPSLYLRTIPQEENQIGIVSLLRTAKYWAQVGYNNFYGMGIGGGGTFLKRINLGALVEFGTSESMNSKDPSFEIIASYFLGSLEGRDVTAVYGEDLEDEVVLDTTSEVKEELKETEKNAVVSTKKEAAAEAKRLKKEEKKLAKERARLAKIEQDKIEQDLKEAKARQKKLKKDIKEKLGAEKEEQQVQEEAKKVEFDEHQIKEEVVKEEKEIAQNQVKIEATEKEKELEPTEEPATIVAEVEPEKVQLQANEKYEEVETEAGLDPGFYLIANVFGSKKNNDAFLADLNKKGLTPKSFLRSKNNYNYVYLERFNTMNEAREARDTNFNGRYNEKTWIFRVVRK